MSRMIKINKNIIILLLSQSLCEKEKVNKIVDNQDEKRKHENSYHV